MNDPRLGPTTLAELKAWLGSKESDVDTRALGVGDVSGSGTTLASDRIRPWRTP
jgi:hypothetical protein